MLAKNSIGCVLHWIGSFMILSSGLLCCKDEKGLKTIGNSLLLFVGGVLLICFQYSLEAYTNSLILTFDEELDCDPRLGQLHDENNQETTSTLYSSGIEWTFYPKSYDSLEKLSENNNEVYISRSNNNISSHCLAASFKSSVYIYVQADQ